MRHSGQSGNAALMVVGALALAAAGLMLTTNDDDVRPTLDGLANQVTANHNAALELFTALLQPTGLPSKVATLGLEPYLATEQSLVALVPPGANAPWRLEGGCVKVQGAFGGDSTAAALGNDPARGQTETTICPAAARRDAALPLKIAQLDVNATTIVVRAASAAVSFNGSVTTRSTVNVPSIPKPLCRIEVPRGAVTWRSRFDAPLRVYGPINAAWFQGRYVGSDRVKPFNTLLHLVKPDDRGKLGRYLLWDRPRANPTRLQFNIFNPKGGLLAMKLRAGVEGVEGANSRSQCSAYINIKLPKWMKIAAALAAAAAVAPAYVCFAEDTMITMADGSTKPIQDIEAGDLVRNPKTGGPVRVLETVQRMFTGRMRRIEAEGRVLRVTPNHPVKTPDGLLAASELGHMTAVHLAEPSMKAVDARITDEAEETQVVYNLMLDLEGREDVELHLLAADGLVAGDLALQTIASKEREAMSLLERLTAAYPDEEGAK